MKNLGTNSAKHLFKKEKDVEKEMGVKDISTPSSIGLQPCFYEKLETQIILFYESYLDLGWALILSNRVNI